MMHDTLAFTEDGVPLGLLDVQCWPRKPEEAGKGALRHRLPIEQKESMKWLKSYDVDTPIEWMLLTTVATDTFKDACQRIAWYSKRWGIEVYHRTLKSGCRIEDRRLASTDRLEACLAIDCVVAWRIYWLTKQGRETPNIPFDMYLNEAEWQVLWAYVKKQPPPAAPPPIGQITPMIASLGGYLNRKGDGPPGTTTMWRGLVRLQAMAGRRLRPLQGTVAT